MLLVLSALSVLSCLSVTLVYCGQTVGRIKGKLHTRVGLGPGYIMLNVDPAPPLPLSQRGTALKLSAHVHCGQTARWIKMAISMEVGLGQGHTMLDGDPAPLSKKGQSPQFSAPFDCGQTAGCIKMPLGMEVGLGPGHVVLDGTQLRPPPKRGDTAPNFRPMSIEAKRLDGSRCHLVRK